MMDHLTGQDRPLMGARPLEGLTLGLGREWAAAERRGDINSLERTLADDFIGVGPRGFLLNREQWMARYSSGDLKNASFEWDEVTSREYDATAVLIGRQTQQATYQGRDASGQFRATLVFVKSDGAWRLASLHLSPLAQD